MQLLALSLVIAFAAVTLQGCGSDSGDVGKCSGQDKAALSNITQSDLDAVVDKCTKDCLIKIPPLPDSCLDPCFGSALSISDKCGTCFGNLVQCGVHCELPGQSADCKHQCESTLHACGVSEEVPVPNVTSTTTPTTTTTTTTATTAGIATSPRPSVLMKAGALMKRPLDSKVHLQDFQVLDLVVPHPVSDEVLVKVAGSSVNPVDWKMIESPLSRTWSFPHVLGRDCAGTVVAVGNTVTRLRVGDNVWADASEGCYGEYVALKESIVGVAPSKLPLSQAAVLPLVGLTTLDALQKFAGAPWTGNKTVVVLGGSGGTGHVGIQLAKAWGATKVIATCGTDHIDFCSGLGADQVIDYHKQDWFAAVAPRSVDVIYDCVGLGGTGGHAYDILKDGGFFATLLPTALASPLRMLHRRSVKQTFILTKSSDYRDLDTLAALVDAGKLRSHVEKVFSLAELGAAMNASMHGHTTGKISVVPEQQPQRAMLV